MDIIEAIKNRRSIRRYQNTKLSENFIRKVLDIAKYSPNSGNLQRWKFIVINSRIQLEKLSWAIDKVIGKSLKKKFSLEKKPIEEKYFYNAPILILVSAPKEHIWSEVDCAIVSQTIMLYTYSLGLGSCWTGFPVVAFKKNKRLGQDFNIPKNYQVYAAFLLGYPKEIPRMPPRKNIEILWLK